MRLFARKAPCRQAALLSFSLLATTTPGGVQAQQAAPSSIEDIQTAQGARTAKTVAGDVGQRKTREEVSPNLVQKGRIVSRVQNRIQNRIRNRIDREYDPVANAVDPFEAAADRTRTAGRRSQQQ